MVKKCYTNLIWCGEEIRQAKCKNIYISTMFNTHMNCFYGYENTWDDDDL